MRSTIDCLGKTISCSRLILGSKFFGVSKGNLLILLEDFYSFVNNHFGNECVLEWSCDEHAIKSCEDIKQMCLQDNPIMGMELRGNVLSSMVTNKASMRKYERLLNNSIINNPMNCSADYMAFYNKNVKNHISETDGFKKALIDLFNVDDREYIDIDNKDNIYGDIIVKKELYCNGYCGEIRLSVSCFCLDSAVNKTAENFFLFSKKLTQTVENINSAVFIGTDDDDSRYFSGIRIRDPKAIDRNYMLDSLARERYLLNVGWATVLSSSAAKLLNMQALLCNSTVDVSTETLNSGALAIVLNCDAGRVKMGDLKVIRKMVYPALLPGGMIFNKDTLFRKCWETVPILDEEISIDGQLVKIAHKGSANIEYLFPEKEVFDTFYDCISAWLNDNPTLLRYSGFPHHLSELLTIEYSNKALLSDERLNELLKECIKIWYTKIDGIRICKRVNTLTKILLLKYNSMITNF